MRSVMLIRKFASINRHSVFSVVESNRDTHRAIRRARADDTVGDITRNVNVCLSKPFSNDSSNDGI